jgi:hypothetical protein
MMTLEVRLKEGIAGTESLKAAIEEKIREATKLRGTAVFVAEIPEGGKKIEDQRSWQ